MKIDYKSMSIRDENGLKAQKKQRKMSHYLLYSI